MDCHILLQRYSMNFYFLLQSYTMECYFLLQSFSMDYYFLLQRYSMDCNFLLYRSTLWTTISFYRATLWTAISDSLGWTSVSPFLATRQQDMELIRNVNTGIHFLSINRPRRKLYGLSKYFWIDYYNNLRTRTALLYIIFNLSHRWKETFIGKTNYKKFM